LFPIDSVESAAAVPCLLTEEAIHSMPQGAELQADGSVRFRIWAPAAETMKLQLEGGGDLLSLSGRPDGWYELVTREAHAGSRYYFSLPDGLLVPDPASRFQPEDVHGPSEVIDPAGYRWRDSSWQGRAWQESVLYELHVGTFTDAGTFLAAIEKLDHLVQLGITGIEVMPVADFPGRRNWGYDGALLYAPDSSYGRPEDFKALIDAAHQRGLMVILDVVYNHFGPDGNYLPVYAPRIFTDHHKTPWGNAVNYDSEGNQFVREFIIHNALYWIEEFHLDGLRLDAVHEIHDDSDRHVLDELADRVHHLRGDFPIHLILENEANEAGRLARNIAGRPKFFSAQWNDDMHHVLHTAATLETHGYYGDYKDDTVKLGRALAEGFAFQGEVMQATDARRGEASGYLPPDAFVAFMQNHDQIGNRAFGERISAIACPEAIRAIAAIYLLLPQVPMLFMGEEWGSSQPFPFFCDFGGELGEQIRQGRRQEFAAFPEFRDPEARNRIPDPLDEQTFWSGKLDWGQIHEEPHREWLDWYKRMIAVRKAEIIPRLPRFGPHAGTYQVLGTAAVIVRFKIQGEDELILAANLSDTAIDGYPRAAGETIWYEGSQDDNETLGPWSVRWSRTKIGDKED
jgi:maltooligosyltrehalose trehalohydrolase